MPKICVSKSKKKKLSRKYAGSICIYIQYYMKIRKIWYDMYIMQKYAVDLQIRKPISISIIPRPLQVVRSSDGLDLSLIGRRSRGIRCGPPRELQLAGPPAPPRDYRDAGRPICARPSFSLFILVDRSSYGLDFPPGGKLSCRTQWAT
jgi:hypothetical protein